MSGECSHCGHTDCFGDGCSMSKSRAKRIAIERGLCVGPYIQIKFGGGSMREAAHSSALRLAQRLECPVEWDWNGVHMWCYPDDTLPRMEKRYELGLQLWKDSQPTESK